MTAATCPDCRRPLPVDAPGGLCPACLLRLAEHATESPDGLDTCLPTAEAPEVAASPAEMVGNRIGRYRLLEAIGEGGFGKVWMAQQEEPVRRKVALKIVKLGMDTRQVVARFEAERQALALMDHPNIARVFDAGATAVGRPYFVMELVRGLPITEFCDARQLSTRERIELFLPVCQAVQHAHQKGVIHRDLKPSNILVTEQDGRPVPKVIDFGVAKAIEEPLTDKTLFTRFHQFLGTPAYMSPEQAGLGGLDVDTRSDIYSLGVLLYELLTGEPPLNPSQATAASPEALLRTIREVEPTKPSTRLSMLRREDLTTVAARRREDPERLPRMLRGDLDWIVLKALEKDRARRYATANGLAADLLRSLDDEPITARPPGVMYRVGKLARRNRLWVSAVTAVVIALLAGLATTSWQWFRASRHLAEARLNRYVREVFVAQEVLADNNLARTRELLEGQRPQGDEPDLRGFEWRYLWDQCQGAESEWFGDESAEAVDFTTDGRWFAYGGWRRVVVRQTDSHQVLATLETVGVSLSFSPEGSLLATAGPQDAVVWDTRTWREARRLPGAGGVTLFSPDGKWLLTGRPEDGRLVLWDRATWQPAASGPATPALPHHLPNGLAFSPDGKVLAGLWVDFFREIPAGLRFWEVPSLEPRGELLSRRLPLACAAFEPGGKRLLTGTWDGRLVVWDLTTPEPQVVQMQHQHSSHISRVAISARGNRVATAGEDQALNLWEAGTYRHLARLRGHTNQIGALAISPDGRTVVTGSGYDGVTRVWKTDRFEEDELQDVGSLIAGFTSDSRTLVLGPRHGDRRWHLVGSATAMVEVPTHQLGSSDLLHKPFDVYGDQPLGVLGRGNGAIELWNLAAGTPIAGWPADTNEITVARFSPDGRQIAIGSSGGRVSVWNVAGHGLVRTLQPAMHPIRALAFSPDGRTLVVAAESSPTVFWVWAGDEVSPAPHRIAAVAWIEFSPDGRTVALADLKGEVNLYDVTSMNPVATLRGHVMGVLRASFFPDGKTLVTGSLDGRVKLWNLASHQEVLTLSVPLGCTFHSLAIAPNGRRLAVGYLGAPGHHVRLYSARSLDEISRDEIAARERAPRTAR